MKQYHLHGAIDHNRAIVDWPETDKSGHSSQFAAYFQNLLAYGGAAFY